MSEEDRDANRALSDHASKLLSGSLVWDNHACLPFEKDRMDRFLPQLLRYSAAGASIVSLNVGYGTMTLAEHVSAIAAMRAWVAANPDLVGPVATAEDAAAMRSSGRLGIVFDIEGMAVFGDRPELVGLFYDLGVRWTLIAYNRGNQIGGGCHDQNTGLTQLGQRFLDEMARVGMVVCCSHTAYATVRDVCAYHRQPVILSHSNPRALCDHPRNVPDDILRAIAATDGVIGLNGIGIFLKRGDTSSRNLAEHIDYVVQKTGPRHVGLGLDYVLDRDELADINTDRPDLFPPGYGYDTAFDLVAPEQYGEIVDALIKLGYTDADLKAILGGNHLRIAETVWR